VHAAADVAAADAVEAAAGIGVVDVVVLQI
jgi:hypothetical protein